MPAADQLAFDFEELAREEAREHLDDWAGAPLHFTTDYSSPNDLDAAFEHWCFVNGHRDSIRRSHMWHRFGWKQGTGIAFDEHEIATFSADLSLEHGAEGPGGLVRLAVCAPCEWHVIDGDENRVIEAWHDHAIPGWRGLPVIPEQVRVRDERGLTALARKWIEVHYPKHIQVPGAPIVTDRTAGSTRHVAGYSPWGGYDLSSTALAVPADEEGAVARDRSPLDLDPEYRPDARATRWSETRGL